MATTIAVSGKGGAGKTTLAAMVIRSLCGLSGKGVLAVDADPNSCLGLMMGVEQAGTIAEIREEVVERPANNTGMDKVRSFEYGIQQVITEANGFDLLTMGRPEGPGCYCAANNLLRTFLDKLSLAYEFMVIDNEAGMEHLSRRTTNNIDLLCITAEANYLGEITAQRIFELAKKLPISVRQIGVIWNRAARTRQLNGIESLGCVPYDQDVFEASMQGKTIFDLQEDNRALLAVRKIFEHKIESALRTCL